MKKILILALLLMPLCGVASVPFRIDTGMNVTVNYPSDARPVLASAVEVLGRDLNSVFGDSLILTKNNAMVNVSVDSAAVKESQGFCMKVTADGKLSITGHDSHGAAYGIMELSRLIGVSPWEWWADSKPEPKEHFELPVGYTDCQAPSVEYRGIFINDEDWGLMQWSSLNYEPWYKPGRIGPKTNEKIFELMLRLRANYYWPAMHECTVPFFLTKGNREMAEKYGIYIGGSHCEPMASSTAGEWPKRGKGEYDYVNNSDNVYRFWEDRVKDVAGQEIIYTVGMRGVHDGAMNGAKTLDEQKSVLSRVITDQRNLLSKYVNPDITKVPQVFIPYKEVQKVYEAGLEVPEDVTLMWCDDNYGYIHHFPTKEERERKGGNGVYYHVSYWGRPHDYLWLGTFSPALLWQQMNLAYDKGIRKMWILNVGDIKPAEYQIELFMDMAWNMDKVRDKGWKKHLYEFLSREFGVENASLLSDVLVEAYRLAYIRKPEFMGNTREEEYHTNEYRIVRDLPWDMDSIQNRLNQYERLSDMVESINPSRKDTYFQLVKYPVQAAAQMNNKMLYAQMARHGKADWKKSDVAYDSISTLTRIYNIGIENQGKWHRIMDFQPRRLPVFEPLEHREDISKQPVVPKYIYKLNGTDAEGRYNQIEGLGYESGAIELIKNNAISFDIPAYNNTDSVSVDIRLLPVHPIEEGKLSFSLRLDNEPIADEVRFETYGRSEEWKENVLRNQAIRTFRIPCKNKPQKLKIKALTEGVIVDQIIVY